MAFRQIFSVLLTVLIPLPVTADSVDGAYQPQQRSEPQKRTLAAPHSQALQPALQIDLGPVREAEREGFGRRSGSRARMIGFARALPPPYSADLLAGLSWSARVDGGQTALIAIRSPGAAALRVKLDLAGIPEGARYRYLALSADEEPLGPIRYDADHAGGAAGRTARTVGGRREVWSPVVFGDVLGLEITFPPGVNPREFRLPAPSVSHIVEFPGNHGVSRQEKALGDSSSCEVDVTCRDFEPWSSVKDAVAKISYVKGSFSYFCSATLLADREDGDWIPYVLTANHCISDAAAAATVNSWWFFQRAGCAGPVDPGVRLYGGSWLLNSGVYSDFSLLQLKEPAPGGSLFAGWQTESSLLDAVVSIHHPEGDIKKFSEGSVIAASSCREAGNCGFDDIEVRWSEGHTESGSSGGGLFDAEGKLIGTLWGGSSYCEGFSGEVFGSDAYGRFAHTLPQVSRFLNAQATPLTLGSIVDGSAAEPGWRDFRIDPNGASRIGVTLDQLSTDADLYLLAGSKPTPEHFDCRSSTPGAAGESCGITVPSGVSVYAGVYSHEEGSFRVTASGVPPEISLINISTNTRINEPTPGGSVRESPAIAGFIIQGSGSRRIIVMGENAGSLSDPVLKLTDLSGATLIEENDDWRDHPTADEVTEKLRAPAGALDAAFAVTLGAGSYLATLGGKGESGQGIVSVTDVGEGLARGALRNISTNGFVAHAGMIAGLIATGPPGAHHRAVLMGENAGTLADPVLKLTDLAGNLIEQNDDWQSHATAAEVVSKLRPPAGSQDAAFAIDLAPGTYLLHLSGKNGATGRGLVSATLVD